MPSKIFPLFRLPVLQIFRGFHVSSICTARGRVPPFSAEILENKLHLQENTAHVTAPIDESETPVIELSKDEIVKEIERKQERKEKTEEANADLPPFQKLADSDKTFGQAMQLTMKTKKNRLVALEGRRLIEDALHAGIKCESVFFSKKDLVRGIQLPEGSRTKFFKTPYQNLRLWTALTTCPGITGIFHQPITEELQTLLPLSNENNLLPVNLVCDQVRDPGNMGAILRVAAAAGCNQVITTQGCVNIWDTKVIRASMGSVFRVPVSHQSSWDQLGSLVDLEKASVFLADNRESIASELQSYSNMSYLQEFKPIVLVVGGETLGLSSSANKLSNAIKIHIPLTHGVESLNVGSAVAVILFEIRRQKLVQEHRLQAE
ncbi:rRNA methyltransferase 3, mitochondrial [Neocloeon triangulifer]|uniref:rRNA methyltransferase 3, mitochondrial n=1 Tax=Neocloeon triangulifer TaxID=2078957 RepID=UPI00286EE55E|nr:rRNA methyltransferase 3, mitochondrial [Neocloeon triangulifer]XP_059480469.1 rRNA methyltransferase 3, mitochondrial [Neocloeon triangulifer]